MVEPVELHPHSMTLGKHVLAREVQTVILVAGGTRGPVI